MAAVIYNCKRCEIGKRVEYPLGDSRSGHYRVDSNGKRIPAAVWIRSAGGGKPTLYDGDTENGLCRNCGKMMDFGQLKASLRPEVKCSAICTNARGHSCDCSCGGANHGSAA
jgi:hypothetical protein